jgi:hypothetical protein
MQVEQLTMDLEASNALLAGLTQQYVSEDLLVSNVSHVDLRDRVGKM